MTDVRGTSRGIPPERPAGPDRPAGPTIVGARPPGEGTADAAVPNGLDTLLARAAGDPRVKADLLERRAAAASRAGIALTADEEALLAAAPAEQLEVLLRNLPAVPAAPAAPPLHVLPPAGIRPDLAERGIRPGLPPGTASTRHRYVNWLLGAFVALVTGLLAWWLGG